MTWGGCTTVPHVMPVQAFHLSFAHGIQHVNMQHMPSSKLLFALPMQCVYICLRQLPEW